MGNSVGPFGRIFGGMMDRRRSQAPIPAASNRRVGWTNPSPDFGEGADDDIRQELARLGVHLPAPRQNAIMPEPGSDNFMGRHPRLARGLDAAMLAGAAYQQSGTTVGAGIADALRAALVGGPALHNQIETARVQGPMQMGLMASQLRHQEAQDDLMASQAAENLAQARKRRITHVTTLDDGTILNNYDDGTQGVAGREEEVANSPLLGPQNVFVPYKGITKEPANKYTLTYDAQGRPYRANVTEGKMTLMQLADEAGNIQEGPLPIFPIKGSGTGGSDQRRAYEAQHGPQPADPAAAAEWGRGLERFMLTQKAAGAGAASAASHMAARPFEEQSKIDSQAAVDIRDIGNKISSWQRKDVPKDQQARWREYKQEQLKQHDQDIMDYYQIPADKRQHFRAFKAGRKQYPVTKSPLQQLRNPN